MLGIFEARVAGKQSYDFFLELGDLRGQAAALLVQSHVCIKSKNQDKDREPEEHTLNHNSVWLCHQTCINSKTWNSLYIYNMHCNCPFLFGNDCVGIVEDGFNHKQDSRSPCWPGETVCRGPHASWLRSVFFLHLALMLTLSAWGAAWQSKGQKS